MNWRVDYNQLFLANIYPFIHGHTFRPCLYFTQFVFLYNKKYIQINSEMRTIWCIISTSVSHKSTNNSLKQSFYVTTNVISYFNQGYAHSNCQCSGHIFLIKENICKFYNIFVYSSIIITQKTVFQNIYNRRTLCNHHY